MVHEAQDKSAVSVEPDWRLRRFVLLFAFLILSSYSFLSYWEYSREFYSDPLGWSRLVEGHGSAPQQYRVGVLLVANFVADFLSAFSHGHLALRHLLPLLDLLFLTIGIATTLFLVTRTSFYREASYACRCTTQLLTIALLLFYLSWTFWYHKPETIANFAGLSLAALLLSGKLRIPAAAAGVGLVLVSIYLATIRADSGLALNLGILLFALLPRGKVLPLGRIVQALAGGMGLIAVLGVEFYIKNVLYPASPFSDPLFELIRNLRSPVALFCVCIALAPYFLTVFLPLRRWRSLEAWESVLLAASLIEFALFLVVAHANEVRLFLPFPMALLPTSAALLGGELTTEKPEQPSGAKASAHEMQL